MSDRTLDLDPEGVGLYLVRADESERSVLGGPIDSADTRTEIADAEDAIGAEVDVATLRHSEARARAVYLSRRAEWRGRLRSSTGETYVGP